MGERRKFGLIKRGVALDYGLTAGEFAVYAALCVFANEQRTCFPSLSRIMDESGVKSENTVRKHLSGLQAKGLIKTFERRGASNLVVIYDQEELD